MSQNKVGNYQLGCGDLQKGCSKLPIKGLYGTAAQVGRDNLTLHRAHLFYKDESLISNSNKYGFSCGFAFCAFKPNLQRGYDWMQHRPGKGGPDGAFELKQNYGQTSGVFAAEQSGNITPVPSPQFTSKKGISEVRSCLP